MPLVILLLCERLCLKNILRGMRKMALINLKELEHAATYAVGSKLDHICASIEQMAKAMEQDGVAGAIVFTPHASIV